jgi:hypothetical protein
LSEADVILKDCIASLEYALSRGLRNEIINRLSKESKEILFDGLVSKSILEFAIERYNILKISCTIMDEDYRSNRC